MSIAKFLQPKYSSKIVKWTNKVLPDTNCNNRHNFAKAEEYEILPILAKKKTGFHFVFEIFGLCISHGSCQTKVWLVTEVSDWQKLLNSEAHHIAPCGARHTRLFITSVHFSLRTTLPTTGKRDASRASASVLTSFTYFDGKFSVSTACSSDGLRKRQTQVRNLRFDSSGLDYALLIRLLLSAVRVRTCSCKFSHIRVDFCNVIKIILIEFPSFLPRRFRLGEAVRPYFQLNTSDSTNF